MKNQEKITMHKLRKHDRSSGMDMLHGSMVDKILLFALPLALGSILQQLFNAVDVAVVGRFASSQALAAVGANSSVVSLLVNLFVGISVGSNVVIAGYIGENRPERIKATIHTSLLVALTSGIFLSVTGFLIAKPLLTLMSTPEDVIDLAVLYLRIYCMGMPFIMLYNFGAAILRSVGDTKRPLICLITSGFINALLNIFFVIILHMDVSGVAIATVISNVVSSCMALHFLTKADEPIRLSKERFVIKVSELKRILWIGIPAGLQGLVFSVSNVCIQSAVNSFGSAVVAGCAIAANCEYISYYAVNGFNAAVMTFTSQNYGAKNIKRCKRAYTISILCAMVSCLILNSLFYLNRGFLIGFFTTDPSVAQYAMLRMKYILALQFLICTYEISGSALRGYGYSLTPALLTVLGTCVIRIIWINTVVKSFHTFFALMAVYPFTWIVTGTLVMTAHFIRRNRLFPRSPASR